MFSAAVKTLVVIAIYAAVSGFAAWSCAEILGSFVLFGSGPDYAGGKVFSIIFVAFPALWFIFFTLLFFVRKWPLGSCFDGRRGFVAAVGAWLASYGTFYAWMYVR